MNALSVPRKRGYPGQGLSSDRGQRGGPSSQLVSEVRIALHLRELAVVKKDGRRTSSGRYKLARSIQVAVRKRAVDPERIVIGIQRRLESSGEPEVLLEPIGEMVMESLLTLDPAAYIRLASIYKNFSEVEDFDELVGKVCEQDHPFGA